MEPDFLETERLRLRRLCAADFADFCGYAMDAEMSRMMGREDLTDPAAARRNFDWLLEHEPRAYGIVCKEDGKLIGNLNVTALPPPAGGAPRIKREGRLLALVLPVAAVPAQGPDAGGRPGGH